MPAFQHHELRLLNPRFDSPLLDVLTELEHLRRLEVRGTTPAPVFFQLKHVFHMLESLASARIEGNHTTLADLIETRVSAADEHPSDPLKEILNIESAMQQIDSEVQPESPITEHMLRGWHHLTVTELVREGDRTPGAYRTGPVTIAKAEHLPPDAALVPSYMAELVAFINRPDPPKYDLMKVALAHHRFGWVHPFGNGNGRVVRLLTYALLVKYGFKVREGGRLLNPAAVFCSDRERYYAMLATADKGTDPTLEDWCSYVLDGVLVELKKVDRLTDYDKLKSDVLLPALKHARDRDSISALEYSVLSIAIQKGVVRASDLQGAMGGMALPQRTYQIKKLVTAKLLQPLQEGSRQYTLGFSNSTLMRGIVKALTEQGFISQALAEG